MSTELNCIVHQDINVSHLGSILKEHMIVHDPPYNLNSLISPYITRQGRRLKIILHHSSRNVSIVDDDIRHHVLQTAVTAFQAHQLSMGSHRPRQPSHWPSQSMVSNPLQRVVRHSASAAVQDTGKQCSICFETIMSDQLHCLPCAHVFHDSCVRRWFEQSVSCPVCRLQLA